MLDEEDEELLVGWEDEEGVLDAELVVRAFAKAAAPFAASFDVSGLDLNCLSAEAIAALIRALVWEFLEHAPSTLSV